MSKDILIDIDILNAHPQRINKLIERIIQEIEALRQEGYELYTITVQKQHVCNNAMEKLSQQYNENKNSLESYSGVDCRGKEKQNPLNSKHEARYRDSQEGDFYQDDLKQQYNKLDNQMSKLNHSKETLEDISQQIVNITKTTEDIKQMSEYWNKIYNVTINGLIELN